MSATVTTRAELAAKRVENLLGKFTQFNRTLPDGMPPLNPNLPGIEQHATLDALVELLIDASLIDQQEFLDRKYEKVAHIIEQAWEGAREQKRKALGLKIASPADLR